MTEGVCNLHRHISINRTRALQPYIQKTSCCGSSSAASVRPAASLTPILMNNRLSLDTQPRLRHTGRDTARAKRPLPDDMMAAAKWTLKSQKGTAAQLAGSRRSKARESAPTCSRKDRHVQVPLLQVISERGNVCVTCSYLFRAREGGTKALGDATAKYREPLVAE